jgi:recombinational DNA repair protein RecR
MWKAKPPPAISGELLSGEGIKITRIAQGLPAGIGLENADDLTRAFSGRTVFKN